MAWGIEIEIQHICLNVFVEFKDKIIQLSGLGYKISKAQFLPILLQLYNIKKNNLTYELAEFLANKVSGNAINLAIKGKDSIRVVGKDDVQFGTIQGDTFRIDPYFLDTCVEFCGGPYNSQSKIVDKILKLLKNFSVIKKNGILLPYNSSVEFDQGIKFLPKKTICISFENLNNVRLKIHHIKLEPMIPTDKFFRIYLQYTLGINIEQFFVSQNTAPLLYLLGIGGKGVSKDAAAHKTFLFNLGKMIQNLSVHNCAKGIFCYLMYCLWQIYFYPVYYKNTIWKNAFILFPRSGISAAVSSQNIEILLQKSLRYLPITVDDILKQIVTLCKYLLNTVEQSSWIACKETSQWATWSIEEHNLIGIDKLPANTDGEIYFKFKKKYQERPLQFLVEIVLSRFYAIHKFLPLVPEMTQKEWFNLEPNPKLQITRSDPLIKMETRHVYQLSKPQFGMLQSEINKIQNLAQELAKPIKNKQRNRNPRSAIR